MADILIRGMAMPTCCLKCPLNSDSVCLAIDGCTYDNTNGTSRRGDCPLVPLQEGHGDLIDRDAFRADYGLGKDCENCDRNTRNCNYDICLSRMDVCGWIDDAPTIVPAEGGGEDG